MKKLLGVAALVVLFSAIGSASAVDSLGLTINSSTSTTVTVGWTPPANAEGYKFYADGQQVGTSLVGTKASYKFTRAACDGQVDCYQVKVLTVTSIGSSTGQAAPPPPATGSVTQTIADGSTITDIVNWQAVYDANGDGIEDDPGQIQFYIDGALVLTESYAPFGDTFLTGSPSTTDGRHTFMVKAISDTGTVLATNTVTATVSSAPPPPPPPASGYPDASNTGVPAGTPLTPVSGSMTVSTAGQVVNAVNANGVIFVTAANVTIQNSKARGVEVQGSGSATIKDTEIDCGGSGTKGILGQNFTVLRVNIHNCEDGVYVYENNFTVQDSYIHDLATSATAHNDGIQVSCCGSNSIIKHNRIYGVDTSAINYCNSVNCGTSANVLIEDNLLAGGGYTLYCPIVPSSNFQVVNNKFSTIFYSKVGLYGDMTDCDGEILSGNVIYETGAPA